MIDTKNVVLSKEQALNMVKACLELGQVRSLDLFDAKDIFINLKHINAVRPATIKYYIQLLNQVISDLNELNVNKTSDVTNEVIIHLLAKYTNRNLSNAYINKLISALIHLITLLASFNYIDFYSFNFKKLKEDIKEIKVLTPSEIDKIMKYILNKDIQFQIAFRLFFETGIRRTELVNIMVKNIDFKNKQIYLNHTKNHEPRYIFLSEITIKLISEHLKQLPQNCDYLFFNNRLKKKVTTAYIDSLFLKTKKDLDLCNLGPHLLRHTYCTAIARSNSVDIKTIQTLMGHKTLSMTMRYIQLVSQDKLATASVLNNPLAYLE